MRTSGVSLFLVIGSEQRSSTRIGALPCLKLATYVSDVIHLLVILLHAAVRLVSCKRLDDGLHATTLLKIVFTLKKFKHDQRSFRTCKTVQIGH